MPEQLDERFRSRLRAAMRDEAETLSPAAESRVVDAVRVQGARELKWSRPKRIATQAALALAAIVGGYGVLTVAAREPAQPAAPTAHDTAQTPPPNTPPIVPKRCESFSTHPAKTTDNGTRRVLDFGSLAYVVASSDSDVHVKVNTQCSTVLTMTSGSAVVHAKDLGGGAFVVETPEVAARVRGTVFEVSRQSGNVEVSVAEGRVLVERRGPRPAGETALSLDPGQRVTLSVGASRRSTLSAQQVSDLNAQLTDVSDATEPAASARPGATGTGPTGDPEKLLVQANLLARQGKYEQAGRLYRAIGAGKGPTAEAAWLALARMELQRGNTKAATDATKSHSKRFARGTLGPESLWIEVRAHKKAGRTAQAKAAARRLVQKWPKSPQASAARAILRE